jgi:hypothetical protein
MFSTSQGEVERRAGINRSRVNQTYQWILSGVLVYVVTPTEIITVFFPCELLEAFSETNLAPPLSSMLWLRALFQLLALAQ